MKGFKKAITLFVVSALCLTASCSNSTTPQNKASDKEIEKENKNEVVEAPVELIYAKSPEEAAEKCLEAIRSGNLDEAKHYVEYNGNAFKEISEFKSKMMTSYKAENNDTRREKVEKYISNFFGELTYSKKSSEQSDNSATVIYSVSLPDMSKLGYSSYSDLYMAANGISPETLMTEIESMSREESENWSLDFTLDVINYTFENNLDIPKTDSNATISLKKSKEGWIVTDIKNLAG